MLASLSIRYYFEGLARTCATVMQRRTGVTSSRRIANESGFSPTCNVENHSPVRIFTENDKRYKRFAAGIAGSDGNFHAESIIQWHFGNKHAAPLEIKCWHLFANNYLINKATHSGCTIFSRDRNNAALPRLIKTSGAVTVETITNTILLDDQTAAQSRDTRSIFFRNDTLFKYQALAFRSGIKLYALD